MKQRRRGAAFQSRAVSYHRPLPGGRQVGPRERHPTILTSLTPDPSALLELPFPIGRNVKVQMADA